MTSPVTSESCSAEVLFFFPTTREHPTKRRTSCCTQQFTRFIRQPRCAFPSSLRCAQHSRWNVFFLLLLPRWDGAERAHPSASVDPVFHTCLGVWLLTENQNSELVERYTQAVQVLMFARVSIYVFGEKKTEGCEMERGIRCGTENEAEMSFQGKDRV